nr:type II toxin-antitoxin system RelE/ParE family toxin [Ruegeria sp. HKCCA0370]
MSEIWAYIAQESPQAATSFVNQIAQHFEPLLHHPEIGPSRADLAAGLRVHFHRNYAIYYTFTNTELIIVHVVHGARDVAALFSDQDEEEN